MRYSTQVEKNDEGLAMIINAAVRFDEGRYLEALYMNRVTPEKVVELTVMARGARARMAEEMLRLNRFANDFVGQYATDNNKCFEAAEQIFNRIRSTISYSKKIYKKFCPRTQRQLPDRSMPSVFSRSALASMLYNGQLFGLETYDERVQTLYLELEGFFVDLTNCLRFCHMVIMEELRVRQSPKECMAIFSRCYDEMKEATASLVRSFSSNHASHESEEARRWSQSVDRQAFVCDEYHSWSRSQFSDFVVATQIEEGRRHGLTEVESMLFGVVSLDKVERIRYVISHFDELEPEGQKGKLDASWVAAFMLWCEIGVGDKKGKMFVENYFTNTYSGRYEVPKINAVNAAKNKLNLADEKTFLTLCCDKIEQMIVAGFRLAQQKEQKNTLPLV